MNQWKKYEKIMSVFKSMELLTYSEVLKRCKGSHNNFYRPWQDLITAGRIVECKDNKYKCLT